MPKLLIVSSDAPEYMEIFAKEAPELECKQYKADDPSVAEFVQEMDFLYAWYFPPELVKDAPLRMFVETNARWVPIAGSE